MFLKRKLQLDYSGGKNQCQTKRFLIGERKFVILFPQRVNSNAVGKKRGTRGIMWKIRHIFDGDYGCEGLLPGQSPRVSVTLVDEERNERYVSVENAWLTEQGLDVGDNWPCEMKNPGN